ncbi:hypothetical protein [Streptomyces sp. NPDC056987]|uniref:hypothetical protein n=1 Tax=Streptomyces sp. NPDC056987 TaxID=3345988 RepID=UPI003633D201
MTTAPAEANFSDLINSPTDTVHRMQDNPRKGICLHRRGSEEDLYLTTAARAEEVVQVVDTTTRMFVALMKTDPMAVELLTRVFPDAFPWVRFLPQKCVQEFLVELIETARSSTELGLVAPIARLVTQWRHTAEVYSDPDLLARLTAEDLGDDYGPTPLPLVDSE